MAYCASVFLVGACLMQGVAAITCEQAYFKQCYKYEPFRHCCHEGECQDGGSHMNCAWSFELPCCRDDLASGTFKYNDGKETECMEACNALGDSKNIPLDYCPDGKWANSKKIAACPNAKISLEKVMQNSWKWCNNQGVATCKWQYDFYNHAGKVYQKAEGTFAYGSKEDSTSCTEACALLGNSKNKPSMYCGNALATQLEGCPEALESHRKQTAEWCDETVATDVALLAERPPVGRHFLFKNQDPLRNLTVDESLLSEAPQGCLGAFQEQCWKDAPFSTCCKVCSKAKATHECSWEFDYDGESIGDQVKSYIGESFAKCAELCDALGDKTKLPSFFCDYEKIDKMIEDTCLEAKRGWESIKRKGISWCTKHQNASELVEETQATSGIAFVAGGAVFVAVIGMAMRLRSRSHDRANDYQGFAQ